MEVLISRKMAQTVSMQNKRNNRKRIAPWDVTAFLNSQGMKFCYYHCFIIFVFFLKKKTIPILSFKKK